MPVYHSIRVVDVYVTQSLETEYTRKYELGRSIKSPIPIYLIMATLANGRL
jgi:hypothetical protein